MQDPNTPAPKRPGFVRALALIAALIVLIGSIFYVTGMNALNSGKDAPRKNGLFLVSSAYAADDFRTLKKGGSGALVKEMQQALAGLGYYQGAQDGNFSRELEGAVKAFQKDFDLKQTGQIDQTLYDLLKGEAPRGAALAQAQATACPDHALLVEKGEWYSDKEHVAAYLRAFGALPDNYLTKREAEALGWDASKGNLWKVAPGMSIGGDRFGNYEGALPEKKGRKYYECDIDFDGGYRNAKRIIFSSDGLIFYTEDHYNTFEEMTQP